jgi:hypothetical protein
MSINREFRIVFQPKNPAEFNNRRRFAVGANSLQDYVGEYNANQAISRAFASSGDKSTVRLRKFGKLDFYVK